MERVGSGYRSLTLLSVVYNLILFSVSQVCIFNTEISRYILHAYLGK
jgi:hypothetical protein